MYRQELIGEAAALRHALYVNSRMRLEFMGGLSKLLRDYGVSVSDEFLREVIVTVPEELPHSFLNAQDAAMAVSELAAAPDTRGGRPIGEEGEGEGPVGDDDQGTNPLPDDDEVDTGGHDEK
jgi:hypothetical protein